ncbi:hypothetical protein JW935_29080, partial [candidate division KSB1 bacterium]|nr:hypothetical protein [candidate division KSB1 bacterium]
LWVGKIMKIWNDYYATMRRTFNTPPDYSRTTQGIPQSYIFMLNIPIQVTGLLRFSIFLFSLAPSCGGAEK